MRKKLCLLLAVLLLTALLCGCSRGGNADNVELTIGPSQLYGESEIRQAMKLVIDQFESGFESCELLTLVYNEADSLRSADEWAEQYHADEAIVLESSFYVRGKNPTLNAFSTYESWEWILTRSGHGAWTLQTWGFT